MVSCGVTAIESCGHGVATVELCSRGGRVIESWRHGGCLMASSSSRWRRSVRVLPSNAARRRSRAAQRPRTVRAAITCCAGTRTALAAASMRLHLRVRGQKRCGASFALQASRVVPWLHPKRDASARERFRCYCGSGADGVLCWACSKADLTKRRAGINNGDFHFASKKLQCVSLPQLRDL